jgi:hypothetical protein
MGSRTAGRLLSLNLGRWGLTVPPRTSAAAMAVYAPWLIACYLGASDDGLPWQTRSVQ